MSPPQQRPCLVQLWVSVTVGWSIVLLGHPELSQGHPPSDFMLATVPAPPVSAPPVPAPPASQQPHPASFPSLIHQLREDLPAYTNRALIRTGKQNEYLLLVSEPDFMPLSAEIIATLNLQLSAPFELVDLTQVFLTTLHRQYNHQQPVDYQTYHWLFFAPHKPPAQSPTPSPASTSSHCAWHLVALYSIQGSYPQDTEPLPAAQDHSNGPLAQAIRQWLQDCPVIPSPRSLTSP